MDADVEAVVNTVNTVGVMGKGIALMFKKRFPDNFEEYKDACKYGEVKVGHMFVTGVKSLTRLKWIINFPTKKHWRQPSKINWVTEGLKDLIKVIERNKINSIAIPPLGCGNGGLDWLAVRPRIVDALGSLSNVDVVIYKPLSQC